MDFISPERRIENRINSYFQAALRYKMQEFAASLEAYGGYGGLRIDNCPVFDGKYWNMSVTFGLYDYNGEQHACVTLYLPRPDRQN